MFLPRLGVLRTMVRSLPETGGEERDTTMSAMNYGKKIGTFSVGTVLCEYVLDVRFSVSEEQFAVLVPSVPGQSVVPGNHDTFEVFRGPVLAAVRQSAEGFLRERDTTTFSDVIEYRCEVGESGSVGFAFRVARVSEVRAVNGRPRLEVSVDVSPDGVVAERRGVHDHAPCPARSYDGYRMDMEWSVPFTVERFKKFTLMRDAVEKLRDFLGGVFDQGGSQGEPKVDFDQSGTRVDEMSVREIEALLGGVHL